MLTIKQLREVFSENGFHPKKSLGENYLIDGNIKDKIIESAGISKKDIVLEIGPGFGAITLDLIKTGAMVYAVEKDRMAFRILSDIVGSDVKNFKLTNGDILDFNISDMRLSGKMKVVGNLPYYITTPIIEYFIRNKSRIETALITIQKEVANRLMASPGTKDYGSISCFVQYYTKPSYLHTIKRKSFYPVPEVDSSLVRLDILDKPSVDVRDEEMLFKIIRGAFNQRRKSIMNSLAREAVLPHPKESVLAALRKIGVDPAVRPEDLSLSDFALIANAF